VTVTHQYFVKNAKIRITQTTPCDRQRIYFYDIKGLGEILDGRGRVHAMNYFLLTSLVSNSSLGSRDLFLPAQFWT